MVKTGVAINDSIEKSTLIYLSPSHIQFAFREYYLWSMWEKATSALMLLKLEMCLTEPHKAQEIKG